MASHRRLVKRFSRDKKAKDALVVGLLTSLVQHGRIKTTLAKAKELRRHFEKLVTLSKKGNLHSYRLLIARLKGNQESARKLFKEISPNLKGRNGGYTRITKLGPRAGDRAEMAVIEIL